MYFKTFICKHSVLALTRRIVAISVLSGLLPLTPVLEGHSCSLQRELRCKDRRVVGVDCVPDRVIMALTHSALPRYGALSNHKPNYVSPVDCKFSENDSEPALMQFLCRRRNVVPELRERDNKGSILSLFGPVGVGQCKLSAFTS